jgi:DNA helicase-2/ATP-dependent DNA helicase PcrA
METSDRETESAYKNQAKLLRLLKAKDNPYFGRIGFLKDGDTSIRQVYIGLSSIYQYHYFYVYDWRSPIAGLFYDCTTGRASYEVPTGEVKGEISLRRQYKIKDGKMLRCFNSDIHIADEYLQEVLSESSSGKLKNIVTTIQQEQNQIIRNDADLIVEGIAGSGKTIVALHRIAYLLYKETELRSENILIFSPNSVFSEYISGVLPELGEENTLQSTFSDFASSYINNTIETFSSFLEKHYRDTDIREDKNKAVKYKLSDEFRILLDGYLRGLFDKLRFTSSLLVEGEIVTGDKLTDIYKKRFSTLPVRQGIERLAEYLCVGDSVAAKKLKRKLLGCLNISLDIEELYMQIITSDQFYLASGVNKEKLVANLNKKLLNYEDSIGLLYLKSKLHGFPQDKHVKYVFIDEVQDYTLLQIEIIKNIFVNACFTLLGDKYQTVNPFHRYDSLEEINRVFHNKCHYIELRKAYRSSEEIVRYTNRIIRLNNVSPIRRVNKFPVLNRTVTPGNISKRIVQDITSMRKSGMISIAIITKDYTEAKMIYDLIRSEFDEAIVISEGSTNFSRKLVIIPSYMTKGLEFDGVIVYTDINNKYTEAEKYIYYVVCTRAMHRLIIYNQKKHSTKSPIAKALQSTDAKGSSQDKSVSLEASSLLREHK